MYYDISQVATGPIQGNKQGISVLEFKTGITKSYISTPEKVDEYINSRKDIISQTNRKGLSALALLSLVGTVIGTAAFRNDRLAGAFGGLIVGGLTACIFALEPLNHSLTKKLDNLLKTSFEQPKPKIETQTEDNNS